jgi:hypothetical protein
MVTMKMMHKFKALLALCRERRRLAAILLLPLVLPFVFAGCASQGVKDAYFDAVEVNTMAPTTVSGVTTTKLPIYTKIAGVPFDLDILAGMYMTDNVSIKYVISGQYAEGESNIDLVDLSAPGCSNQCNSGAVTVGSTCQLAGVTVTANQPTTHAYGGGTGSSGSAYYNWTGGEQGRKRYYGFTVANAAANVRVRIYGKACQPTFPWSCTTATMCSTDAFTVRPASFAVTSTSASTVAAGANFNITAKAVDYSGGTETAYTGTPVLTKTDVTGWWGAGHSIGTLSGSLGAAVAGVSTGSFTYDDFGPLYIPAGAIASSSYVSSTGSGSGDFVGGDCIQNSSSNVLSGGLYGCDIGNQAEFTTPSFVPDHYSVTHTITPACSNKFTYFGQPINVRMTVDAFNTAGNRMTRLTAGAYDKKNGNASITPQITVTQLNSGSATINPVTIPAANLVWSDDTVAYGTSGGEYFTSTTTSSPYALGTLALATTRPAGLSKVSASPPDYESFVLRTTTAATDALITQCNGVSVSSHTCDSPATVLRYGVLKLSDGIATSLTPATVQITAQYWDATSSSFKTNTDDSCTALNFNANTLAATAGVSPAPKSTSATLASGVGTLMLGGSAAGKWAIKLGASDNNCVSATSGGSGTANALSGYLGGVSCSTSYDMDPSSQMQFGTLRSTYIYRSEKF